MLSFVPAILSPFFTFFINSSICGLLPSFVKPDAVHYFSLIGGVLGAFLSMLFFRRLGRDKFNAVDLCIFLFWLFLVATVLLNFDVISMKFMEILI